MHPSGHFRMISSLYAIDFRRLWVSFLAASSGRWALMMALGWLVQSVTGSTFWVGVVVFAQLAPSLVVAPLAGAWADRFDRRHLMVISLLLSFGAAAFLAVLSFLHVPAFWPVIALAFVVGAANTLQATIGSALLPNVVPRAHLLNALALQGTANYGSELVGPLIASPLLVLAGPGAVFVMCAVFNLGAAWSVLRIRPVPLIPRTPGAQPLFAPIWDGLQYVRRNSLLGTILLMVTLHCGLTMSYMGLLPSIAQGSHGSGSGGYGALITAIGLGAVIGSLALTSVADRRLRGRIYLGTAILSGLSLMVIGQGVGLPMTLAAAFAIGLSQTMFMTLSLALIQDEVEDHFRGRVSSIYFMMAMGFMAVCNWAYGAAATVISPPLVLTVVGFAFVLVTIGGGLASADIRLIVGGLVKAKGEPESVHYSGA